MAPAGIGMSIERDEMLARLLLGVRDGSVQALELLTDRGGGVSNPEARGKAAGIMAGQIAMIDAVLPRSCTVETMEADDEGERGGAGA